MKLRSRAVLHRAPPHLVAGAFLVIAGMDVMTGLYHEAAETLAPAPLLVPVPIPAPGAPAAPAQAPSALASASKRGKNFKPSESAVLASCWLAVSCDPVN